AGYRIPITQTPDGKEDIFSITPMVFARTEGTLPPQFDVSVFADYKVLTGGLSYRGFNDSFSAILGFDVNDRMFLGYSFDYTLSPLNASQDLSSHEIILTYALKGGGGRSGAADGVKKDNNGSIIP
ncbi:MAG: type IX secretion system membrane protein PorP/SprF, partial [Bacteroidota bacterium]